MQYAIIVIFVFIVSQYVKGVHGIINGVRARVFVLHMDIFKKSQECSESIRCLLRVQECARACSLAPVLIQVLAEASGSLLSHNFTGFLGRAPVSNQTLR